MSHIPFHPAPGLGDMAPGFFSVPQNPIRPDSTPLVPSVNVAAGGRVTRKPTIGEILPGTFTVPQNPINQNLIPGASLSGLGCGCGCQSGPPAVAMGNLRMIVDVPGSTPYLYGWPNPPYDEYPYKPISMYAEPTTEDAWSYGMAGMRGLGGLTMDGTGLLGTGLFSGGFDVSTWGAGEYVAVGLGLYALMAVTSTGKRHAESVRRKFSAAARA